jgi:peroxiredoxin Q/BCP
MSLTPGDSAPEFELQDQYGRTVRLSDFRGRPVVLFFYPKDDTTGCTKEACRFRDELHEFAQRKAYVLGISSDSVESHARFAAKFSLPYPLLSDTNGQIRKLYGVKKTLGLLPGRQTFVIDAEGKLLHTFSSASQFERHIDEALRALK